MRIAVYTGSFDPLHIGHLAILERLSASRDFDWVYLVISPQNPFWSIIIYSLDEDVHELNFNYTIADGAGFIVGDVNDDGYVTIADVTTLIDILLSGAPAPGAADVNGDSNVSIADVTALIDMLLSGN